MDAFSLEVTERDGLTLVAPTGELDLPAAPHLAEVFERLAPEDRHIVLDLRALTFMDSTGLALILRYHQRAKDGPFDLVVVRGPEPIDRVFRMTNTDSLLDMLDVPPGS